MSSTHDLHDSIDRIESYDGEGTELVTVAVPPDKSLRSVRERIAREHASAENIKSDRTRERVQRALERVRRTLDRYDRTPENGLVAYAGVVDGELMSEAFDDLPAPVPGSHYRCDDHFDVSPLESAARPGETFGLVVVQRGGAAVGRLVGERVVPVHVEESRVMRSSRAGGQSAKRFARERERQAHEFFERVGEMADGAFLGDDPVEGVAVGGTMVTAKRFVEGNYLDHRLTDRVVGTYAVEYATVQGLEQLVDAASERLLDAQRREGRERLEEFRSRLRDGEPVAYGREELERAVEFGAVDAAVLASSLPADERRAIDAAVSGQGGDVYVVSADTERGSSLANAFDGVAALLRFPIGT
jgi:peptide chain release factor subunit 1